MKGTRREIRCFWCLWRKKPEGNSFAKTEGTNQRKYGSLIHSNLPHFRKKKKKVNLYSSDEQRYLGKKKIKCRGTEELSNARSQSTSLPWKFRPYIKQRSIQSIDLKTPLHLRAVEKGQCWFLPFVFASCFGVGVWNIQAFTENWFTTAGQKEQRW